MQVLLAVVVETEIFHFNLELQPESGKVVENPANIFSRCSLLEPWIPPIRSLFHVESSQGDSTVGESGSFEKGCGFLQTSFDLCFLGVSRQSVTLDGELPFGEDRVDVNLA